MNRILSDLTLCHSRLAIAGMLGALLMSEGSAQVSYAAADVGRLKQLSLQELMEVEVTSVSGRPEKLIDTASAIQVISDADIRRYGATTIADSLRLADNLNVAQKDPHDWAISARGFNSNAGDKLLVLIDGRSVYTPLFSGVFWNAQDYLLEDIEQIEVISGPGSSLWGANAVNGVINITTKSAKDTLGFYSQASAGTELDGAAGVRYGMKLAPNIYFRAYAKYIGYNGGALASGSAAKDSWHQAQGGFRLDAEPSPDNTFSVHGDYYDGHEGFQSGRNSRIAGGNLVGRWAHVFSQDSDASVQLYYDRTHLRDPFGASPFAPAGDLIDDLGTYDLDLQDRLSLGASNRIIWGLGYRLTDDTVRQQAPNFAFLPPHLVQSRYSAFAQDEAAVAENVFVTLGSKFEHNDYSGWEVEPNIRLRWQVSKNQEFWSAVSRAVRMPSRLDRDLAEPAPPHTLIEGGKDFMSETVIAYEAGYRAQLNASVSGSISIFYNQYDDLRGLSITPVTILPLVYHNSLEGTSHGFEFSGDIRLTQWWTVHGGFTLLREHIRVKPGQTDFFNALDETADPKGQASFSSSMDIGKNIQADVFVRWVDSLRVNNSGTAGFVPSYTELNIRLGWKVSPAAEIAVVGQNLLNPRHAEFGPPSVNREEIQRGVYATVDWRF